MTAAPPPLAAAPAGATGPPESSAGSRTTAVLAAGAVAAAFAALSLGSTIAKSSGAPGPVVAFWRFALAAAVWQAVAHHRRRRTPHDAIAHRSALVPGVALGVNLSCFFAGVARTPVAHAEFIAATAPVVVVPLAAMLLRERVRREVVLAGAVALAGVGLVVRPGGGGSTSWSGNALVVGSMLTWVVYLWTARAARRRLDVVAFMAVASTAAAVTSLPLAVVSGGGAAALVGLTLTSWLSIAALAVVAGVLAHGVIAWASSRIALGTISMLQLTQPALGAAWAALLLGESVTAPQMVGMALVLAAVGTIAARSAGAPR